MGGATSFVLANGLSSNAPKPAPNSIRLATYNHGLYGSFNGAPYALLADAGFNAETILSRLNSIEPAVPAPDYGPEIRILQVTVDGIEKNISAIGEAVTNASQTISRIETLNNEIANLQAKVLELDSEIQKLKAPSSGS